MRNGRPVRNEPCWCGSGKKYKKCHLQSDQERATHGPLQPSARDYTVPRSILGPEQKRSDEVGRDE